MLSEKQILNKRQYGDNNLVARMLTKETGRYVSPGYVTQILKRPTSKLYPLTINALKQVVESREQLLIETEI